MVVRPIDSRRAASSTVSRSSSVSGGASCRRLPYGWRCHPVISNSVAVCGWGLEGGGTGFASYTGGVAGCLLAAPLWGCRAVGPECKGGVSLARSGPPSGRACPRREETTSLVIFPLLSEVVPGFGAAPRPPEAPALGPVGWVVESCKGCPGLSRMVGYFMMGMDVSCRRGWWCRRSG